MECGDEIGFGHRLFMPSRKTGSPFKSKLVVFPPEATAIASMRVAPLEDSDDENLADLRSRSRSSSPRKLSARQQSARQSARQRAVSAARRSGTSGDGTDIDRPTGSARAVSASGRYRRHQQALSVVIQGSRDMGRSSVQVESELGPGGFAKFNEAARPVSIAESLQHHVSNSVQAAAGKPFRTGQQQQQPTTLTATSNNFKTRRGREHETLSKAALLNLFAGNAPAYRPVAVGQGQQLADEVQSLTVSPPPVVAASTLPPPARGSSAGPGRIIKIQTAGS